MSFVRINASGVLLFIFLLFLLIGSLGSESRGENGVLTPEINVSTSDLTTWNQGSSVIIIARAQGMKGSVNVTFQVDDPAGNSFLILTEPTNQMGEAIINFSLPRTAAIGNYTVTATSEYNSSSIGSNPLTVHVAELDEEDPEVRSSYNWFPLVLGILVIVLIILIVVMAVLKKKR